MSPACDAGGAFVKTSTGFHPSGGATVADVRLMRAAVGSNIGVKASGGIRNHSDARAMLDAGANRIGTSASAAILELLRSPQRWQAAQASGLLRVTRYYTEALMLQRYRDLYQAAMENS